MNLPCRRFLIPVIVAAAAAAPAAAHHIMGIPHYTYDKNYPQAPVLRLREKIGRLEVQLTGFPGRPQPGQRMRITVYITEPHCAQVTYQEPVAMTVRRVTMWGGREAVYGPIRESLERGLYAFNPVFPDEGNYDVVLELPVEGIPSSLTFAMVVGEPGSPWSVLAGYGGGLAALLIVLRAVRIKRARRRTPPAGSLLHFIHSADETKRTSDPDGVPAAAGGGA